MSKILFVYPNKDSCPMIPLGISVMGGVLASAGHKVEVFDITFMVENAFSDNKARERLNFVKKVDIKKCWGSGGEGNIKEKLTQKIDTFNPDIIGFSIVENNYNCAKDLMAYIKNNSNIPIIVGGVFPTVAPQIFINDKNIDLICIGEGEWVMKNIADRLDRGLELTDIENLIVKTKKGLVVNKVGKFYDWNPPTFQDVSIFDPRHLLKPFIGKVWRTGYFELSRGCPYQCSYCVNAAYQEIYKASGPYRRERSIDEGIAEIVSVKEKYNLELVWFHDENFTLMNGTRFAHFYKEYKEKINLPYFVQSSADTLQNEDRVRKMKESGCATIAIGLEVGNEGFRKKVLNKGMRNEIYIKAFENCNKYSIRTTANMMIGFPDETEDNILETIDFCKKCKVDSIGVSILAPYYGTRIRDICIEKGLMEDRIYPDISLYYQSIIKLNIPKEKFEHLYYNFSELVYGRKERSSENV